MPKNSTRKMWVIFLIIVGIIAGINVVFMFYGRSDKIFGFSNVTRQRGVVSEQEATITNLTSTNSTSTNLSVTNIQSDLTPAANNTFNLGSPSRSWQNIYASGTIMVGNGSAASPSITFGSDTNSGLYSVAADQIGFTTQGVQRLRIGTTNTTLTANFISATNNTYDLGAFGSAWKNIYASGTIYGGEMVMSGTSTFMGGVVTGAIEFMEDAGQMTAMDMKVTSGGSDEQMSYAFKLDGWTALKLFSVNFDGTITSGTIRTFWPQSFPVTATTTVATSTSLTFQTAPFKGRWMIQGANIGNTTATTPFATTTEDGVVIRVLGASDTQTVTYCDDDIVSGTGLQLSNNACDVFGAGDTASYIYSYWLGYWTRETDFFDI